MNFPDFGYEKALASVVAGGIYSDDRTGVGTKKAPGVRIFYDLHDGILPLITTKRVPMRVVAEELFWFLRGSTDIRELTDRNVHIWDSWRRQYRTDRDWEFVSMPKRTPEGEVADPDVHQWETPTPQGEVENTALCLWNAMMERSYQEGILVCSEWLDRHAFARDLPELPHFRYWAGSPGDFVLEPRWFGIPVFSPDLTVFAHVSEVIDPRNLSRLSIKSLATLQDSASGLPDSATLSAYLRSLARIYEVGDPHRDLAGLQQPVFGSRVIRPQIISADDLGPIYGENWRRWPMPDGSTFDQIEAVIETLRTDPTSRRMVVNAWNPSTMSEAALPACHTLVQFITSGTELHAVVYQRSADMFLGVPFNLASYGLLTHMIASVTGFTAASLTWNGGDCHVYTNHFDQVAELLSRDFRPLPTVSITPREKIEDITWEDITISGYDPHGKIVAPVAV